MRTSSSASVLACGLLLVLTACSSSSSAPNAAPVFTSGTTGSSPENTTATGYTATATDAENQDVSFSLTGGADQAAFLIDATSGSLSFQSAPDFESPTDSDSNNDYVVEISASDGSGTTAQTVTISVTAVNEDPPVFTSGATASQAENTTLTGYTASATDADNDAVTFSLTGGADQAKFSIDTNSGVLSSLSAPDFENPTDVGSDNVYEVEITATDGVYPVTLNVSITVTDINENPPVFTSSSSGNSPENTTATGYTATATDADLDTVTFSLTGGADQARFSIDANSGVLSFLSAPDFEVPTDSDTNGTYVVEITATDTVNTTALTVTITVTDVLEVTLSTSDVKTLRLDWTAFAGATSYKLFVDPDGASGLSLLQDGLTGTSTTFEVSVHLADWANASYVLEAHDGVGKVSETVPFGITSEMLPAIGYFKASTPESWDNFGESVSLSADGLTLAVGARAEDGDGSAESDNSLSASGAVYIFTRSGSSWSQQAYLKASTPTANSQFGFKVSLSSDGNTLAVGSLFEDSNATGIDGNEADTSMSNAGAVFIFSRSGTTWTQQAYVKASNTDAGDTFGIAVSLSADSNTLAVGAHEEDSNDTGIGGSGADNSLLRSGACYVFTRSGVTWSQQAYIKASNTGAEDHFGASVSLSSTGSTLAVGANLEASNATGIGGLQANDGAVGAGAVYIFTRSGSTWTQQEYIKASNSEGWDEFGVSVSLASDGNTLAVGATGEDSTETGIDGNGSNNLSSDTGAAYIFTRSGATWTQAAYVKPSNPGNSDTFGYMVALSGDGNTLGVGAPMEDSNATGIGGSEFDGLLNAGAAYVFTFSLGSWSQAAYVKASNTGSDDRLGMTLSLTSDGALLAIGASYEASVATGVGGDDTDNSAQSAGAVYVY